MTSTSFSSQAASLTVSVATESVVLRYGGREVAGGQHSLTVICMTRNSILGDTVITSGHQTNMTERWRCSQ